MTRVLDLVCITLVLRLVTDPKHFLYDPRAEEPMGPEDEEFVQDIQRRGVRVPVIARKNGPAYEVVAGRRRVLAAREVNKRQKGKGTLLSDL